VATRFRGSRHGPVARFAAGEVVILTELFGQLLEVLSSEQDAVAPDDDPLAELTGLDTAASTHQPIDPVLARLLPDAYADDPERAAEFRRYTEPELRAGKQAAVHAVLESLPEDGGRIVLTSELADAWLGALNDLRLAIGTRIGVTEDSYDELDRLDPSSERARELTVFTWLGVLQETLVDTLL
jgi:hypothetical protein